MSNTQKSPHTGHRDRLRQRFLVNNGKDFSDHELLELLLFYVIPRMNTNEIAHRLIDEFGSLRNVCNADPARIEKVLGAGKATATFISILFTIRKRIDLERYDMDKFIANSLSKVGNFLVNYYKDKPYEEICVMFLDNSFKLLEFKSVSTGSVNSASVDIKSLVRHAVMLDSTNVIISHNHPYGNTSPSSYDRNLSFQLEAALRTVNISLVEHIIVSELAYSPTLHTRMTNAGRVTEITKYKYFYDN